VLFIYIHISLIKAMKRGYGNSVIILFSASLLCLSNHHFISGSTTPSSNDMVPIFQSFRQSKKIGFSGTGGGSTHFNWVLAIMDELADRGHNVTFFAKVNL
jgi:hypothetical protein